MHNANFRSDPRQPPANLHQATGVAGYHGIHTRTFYRFNLLIKNRGGNIRILNGERTTKSSTGVGIFQLDKFRITHLFD